MHSSHMSETDKFSLTQQKGLITQLSAAQRDLCSEAVARHVEEHSVKEDILPEKALQCAQLHCTDALRKGHLDLPATLTICMAYSPLLGGGKRKKKKKKIRDDFDTSWNTHTHSYSIYKRYLKKSSLPQIR